MSLWFLPESPVWFYHDDTTTRRGCWRTRVGGSVRARGTPLTRSASEGIQPSARALRLNHRGNNSSSCRCGSFLNHRFGFTTTARRHDADVGCRKLVSIGQMGFVRWKCRSSSYHPRTPCAVIESGSRSSFYQGAPLTARAGLSIARPGHRDRGTDLVIPHGLRYKPSNFKAYHTAGKYERC